MTDTSSRQELVEELEADGESYFSSGVMNNIIDLSLIVLTVLASLAATVLAATESVPKSIVAGIAALPAAATSLQRIIGIRERSNWYFLHAANVRALATELKYASAPNLDEFSKKRGELEVEMEKQWLEIGHSGAASGRKPRARRTAQKRERTQGSGDIH